MANTSLVQDKEIEVFMKMIDSIGYGTTKASTFDVLPMSDAPLPFAFGRWYWHYPALIKLRERLLKHRAELTATILEPLQSFSFDLVDHAADQFDHDVALGLVSAEQDTLFEIEAAISRIRTGSYGICEVTGKPIPGARLRAVPWTRFRQEVEEKLEREDVCRPPHLGELKSVQPAKWFDCAGEPQNNNESEDSL